MTSESPSSYSTSVPNSPESVPEPFSLPRETFTYTWSNIDVFSQIDEGSLPRQLYTNLKGCCKSDQKIGKTPKQLLTNVNGLALQGELLAIMGSSGAGKTTLLNVLAFRSPPGIEISPKAQRCLNGHVVTAEELRGNCAYVQQDDVFIGTLKTREHLVYQVIRFIYYILNDCKYIYLYFKLFIQAMLRMTNTATKAKFERVDKVMEEVRFKSSGHPK